MKNIKKAAMAVAIAAVAGYGVYTSQKSDVEMSDLTMANVEALANGEANPGDPCYKGAYNSLLPEATKCAHPCTKERCGGATDKCY